jgi:hypothetical protein
VVVFASNKRSSLLQNLNMLLIKMICYNVPSIEDVSPSKELQILLALFIKLNEGKSAANFCHQVSISSTFYEQLLHQNPFAKKIQTQIVST